jgi:hypothetical protein
MERLKEIETELSGIAPFLGKGGLLALPYGIPEGYFEHFSEDLLAKIKNGELSADLELSALSPLLAGIKREMPYEVPAAYFNDFKPASDRPHAGKGKLVLLSAGSRLLRYASAAILTGVIATAAFFTFHRNNTDPLTALTNVSDQEMANYLDTQDVHWSTVAAPVTASVDFDDNDISDLLSNVSDTELEQYLPDLPVQKRTSN